MPTRLHSATIGICAALALALVVPAVSLASNNTAGQLRVAVAGNADFSQATITAHNESYIVLQPWQTGQLAQIKAANPDTKVLIHENLSGATNTSNNGYYSSGVGYQQADTAHPDWFLKDSSGNRITFQGYAGLYAMDVANPDYQKAWADNVIKTLVNQGFDGVFMDNTDTTMKYDFANTPAKYTTDSQWQAATTSALAYIGPKIQAAGKLAIPNIGSWGGNPSVGRSWLQYVSGAMDEMFLKWGNASGSGYADPGRWSSQLASLKYAQQQGKVFLGVTHSADGDARAARYGWATTLLGAGGRAAYTMAPDYTKATWFPEYDYAIGDATGVESTDSNGVHRRVFTNGIVLVNPTMSPLSANLNGTYSGSGMSNVTSVTLPAQSGYVLTRSGSGTGTGTGTGTDPGATTGGPTTTEMTHTPHHHHGQLKGRVAVASSSTPSAAVPGKVELSVYRASDEGWRAVSSPRVARVTANGHFNERLGAFRHQSLRPGTYRVRGRYLGSQGAKPSTSPPRRFKLVT